MTKVFVINFDDCIIFKTNKGLEFYEEQYETFEEAKKVLVAYWHNVLADAKNKLSEANKMKLRDAHII